MQRLERSRVVAFFAHMQQQAAAQAATAAAAHDHLVVTLQQQLDDAADVMAAAKSLQHSIEEIAQLAAEHIIMQRWADRFDTLRQDADDRFQAHTGCELPVDSCRFVSGV